VQELLLWHLLATENRKVSRSCLASQSSLILRGMVKDSDRFGDVTAWTPITSGIGEAQAVRSAWHE
jgi:hypothetical protein